MALFRYTGFLWCDRLDRNLTYQWIGGFPRWCILLGPRCRDRVYAGPMETLIGALGWIAVPAVAGAVVGITLRTIKDALNR